MGKLVVPVGGYKFNVGVAYIALPTDLKREDYLNDCFKNFHVSIRTEDGGFYNRVPIPPDILNFIVFPKTAKENGTCVLYSVDEQYNTTFITNWFASREDIGDGREGLFRFRRRYEDKFVEISGSAKEAAVNILINGGANNKGLFNLSVTDSNKSSELSVDVGGDINVAATGETSFAQQKGFKVETSSDDDSASFQQSSTENKFYGQKLVVNDGEEPMVLGEKLTDFLGNFIDQVVQISINGSTMRPDQVLKFQALKTQFKSLLSKEGFLKQ